MLHPDETSFANASIREISDALREIVARRDFGPSLRKENGADLSDAIRTCLRGGGGFLDSKLRRG
jgi:hypothetical protein